MPQDILNAPIDVVMGMLEYERFLPEYEERFIELNRPESR